MTRMMQTVVCLLLGLFIAGNAMANYAVRIGHVDNVCPGDIVTVPVTIEAVNGESQLLGGFDLTISYDWSLLYFQSASAGDFITNCGWEYFTYSGGQDFYADCTEGSESVLLVSIVGIAETNNGPIHPSCFAPTGEQTIAELQFVVTELGVEAGDYSDVDFYWPPDEGCGENAFSDNTGGMLLVADNVYSSDGTPANPAYSCGGPDAGCSGGIPLIDYYSGRVSIVGTFNRGDLNWNGLAYEIADAVRYSNYFIYGLSVFQENIAGQVAASDVNCDGITLSIADLVYLIRVIVGDAPKCGECDDQVAANRPSGEAVGASVETSTDTMMFVGAEGWAGQQNVPFDIYVTNSVELGGLEARIEFNQAFVTPSFEVDGENVHFTAVGRAVDFANDNVILVRSYEPGVLLIKMFPNLGSPTNIPVGNGVILRVYFDVNPPLLPLRPSPVSFVESGYDYNMFATAYGQSYVPTLVDSTFTVIPEPSCPVLFTGTNNGFIQENPLLTACEESGYQQTVTDYYHVAAPVDATGGEARFQVRELENEITFLDEIELITVDHSASSNVAVGNDGDISLYDEIREPLRAVDQDGVDRLSEIRAEDGKIFSAEESGYLLVTFAGEQTRRSGFTIASGSKNRCLEPIEDTVVFPKTSQESQPEMLSDLQVAFLADDGHWTQSQTIPPRSVPNEATVWTEQSANSSGEVTMKISWSGSYATDAVLQIIESDESATIQHWDVSDAVVTRSANTSKVAAESGNELPLILVKGDTFEFGFDASDPSDGMIRDYVIVAAGRYEPDFSFENAALPQGFRLYSNYPNPFNPTTTISYDLPATGNVTVEVYNLLGRRVSTLVSGVQEAGHHTVEWSGKDDSGAEVASGIYIYRIVTDDFQASRKMMLVK